MQVFDSNCPQLGQFSTESCRHGARKQFQKINVQLVIKLLRELAQEPGEEEGVAMLSCIDEGAVAMSVGHLSIGKERKKEWKICSPDSVSHRNQAHHPSLKFDILQESLPDPLGVFYLVSDSQELEGSVFCDKAGSRRPDVQSHLTL